MSEAPSLRASTASGAQAQRLFWLLWPSLAVAPWLLPMRTPPWTTFWADALAAAIWLLLAASAGMRAHHSAMRQRVAIDALPALALALILAVVLQALSGRLVFASEAVLVGSYLAAFAAAFILARHCAETAGESFTDGLWASLLIAAVVSVGIGMAQWLKVEPLDWLTPPADVDGRAIANVGQANHLATLTVWGLLAVWRARLKSQLSMAPAALAVAFLLFGLALTQSRTPWVAGLVLVAIAVMGHKVLGGRRMPLALLGAALFYVTSWLVMAHASDLLGLTAPRDAADQSSAGARPLIWSIALEAIAQRPWLGWGWNQFWTPWAELAPGRLPIPSINGYAHNLVLDLLIWNGVIVGGLVTIALMYWFWRMASTAQSAEQWLLLAGVGAFGVHAMLELPHAYTLMLLPPAAMMGALAALAGSRPLARVHRGWIGAAAIGLATLLALIVHDYRLIEAKYRTQRILEAGVLARQPPTPMELIALRWMADADAVFQPRPASAMTSEDVARLRAALNRYQIAGGLARYAQAAVLQGDAAGAAWALRTLCGLHRRPLCEAALREWQAFVQQHPLAQTVPLPPVPLK